MGEVVSLDRYRLTSEQKETRVSSEQRALARIYIYRAASILSDLGEKEDRVSWLLEDCADFLLSEAEREGISYEEFLIESSADLL